MKKPISAGKMASTVHTLDGREYLYFGGSNYLGLNCDESIIGVLSTALAERGFGVGASRATSGETDAFLSLESHLCALLRVPFAAIASSTAVASLIMMELQAASGRGVVLADAALHPSLKAAIAASGLPCSFYRSADVDHAAQLLRELVNKRSASILLCTDGVNPVNGLVYPLAELHKLAADHGATLLVDDAHGFGVLGDGRGTPTHCGLELTRDQIAYIGSFSKAVGAIGGLLAGPFTEAQRRSSIHFATSTPFPAFIAEGIRAAIRLGIESPERRTTVIASARRLRSILRETGLEISETDMPLISFSVGSASKNEALYAALLNKGIWIPLIQYPSQSNESVFRLSVSALHSPSQLGHLAATLQSLL